MTTARKSGLATEVSCLEDALVESILEAGESELCEEIEASGEDPDAIIQRMDTLFETAKAECRIARLREAQESVREFQKTVRSLTPSERREARTRFDAIRSSDRDLEKKLLLAARNGQGATDHDLDSLAEDYDELERMEQEAGENQ